MWPIGTTLFHPAFCHCIKILTDYNTPVYRCQYPAKWEKTGQRTV